jgi:hypothetical protein
MQYYIWILVQPPKVKEVALQEICSCINICIDVQHYSKIIRRVHEIELVTSV